MQDYISGWQALNIPNKQGFCADWHYHFYFKDKKPLKIYPYDKENPLQMQGIYKRKSPFLDKEYFVANYARAIADLVYFDECSELKNCFSSV